MSAPRYDEFLAAELALAQTAVGNAEAGRAALLEATARFEVEPWILGEEQNVLATLTQVEAALGNVDAALEAEQRATGVFSKDRLRPGEWALQCVEMADALQTLAPQRARELRIEARALFEQHAPRRIDRPAP